MQFLMPFYVHCVKPGTTKRTNNDKKMADRLYPVYAADVDGTREATPSEIEFAKKWVAQYHVKYGVYHS
jgi:hypothetical protein